MPNNHSKPYPYGNTIIVRIGGQEHKDWTQYNIDSDFLIPADGFSFETGQSSTQPTLSNYSGEQCEVLINDQLVLTGIIGNQQERVAHGSRDISFSGRDLAGLLVDCSAPQINVKGMAVLAAAKKLVEPWTKIKTIALKSESNPVLDKIDIEPGETAWQALIKMANSVGLHVWFEPDGTLIIGGPDYSSPPVATLCHSREDARHNIQSIQIEYDTENRYSEVTFLGQSHGRAGNSAKHDLKWVYKDSSMALYKPKTVVVGDAENLDMLRKKAKKQLADWRLDGFTLTITVPDHKTMDGVLWQPGQRVHVIDDEQGIDAIFFLFGRTFSLSRSGGTQTELRLKEDGIWIPEAYPDKSERARKRKGKGKQGRGRQQQKSKNGQ